MTDTKRGSKSENTLFSFVVGLVISILFGLYFGDWSVAGIVLIVYLAISLRVLSEWQRSPILTLGRYKGIYGPGIFLIIPVIQSTPYKYDLRTFSSTFSAEKTLTSDNVTVDVDAIMFSRVEDPEKTVLQVSNMENSVTLAAQTALRDVMGKVTLTQMIQGRSEIADQVKVLIDERVLPWGVNVISVELRDVRIPAELQDAMARVAVASRERDARVVLAESEKLAAGKMIDAANMYKDNAYAMQLRALNMIYEVGISGKGSLIFVPTDSKGLGMPTPIGVFGMNDIAKKNLKVNISRGNNKAKKGEK